MKILIMGKFTIEKDHWRVLKEIMGMDKDDKSRIELVNKPDNFILTAETAKEYNMVITTQPNPIVLRNVKKHIALINDNLKLNSSSLSRAL